MRIEEKEGARGTSQAIGHWPLMCMHVLGQFLLSAHQQLPERRAELDRRSYHYYSYYCTVRNVAHGGVLVQCASPSLLFDPLLVATSWMDGHEEMEKLGAAQGPRSDVLDRLEVVRQWWRRDERRDRAPEACRGMHGHGYPYPSRRLSAS